MTIWRRRCASTWRSAPRRSLRRAATPEEAAREARRAFGNITLARERSVEVWQWRWLENLWADLRFALHQLRKSPGYTLTAILTLAIGIGANAAIFTLIDDIMLRSLPVSHPEQLVEIGFRSPTSADFLDGQSPRSMDFLSDHISGLQSILGIDRRRGLRCRRSRHPPFCSWPPCQPAMGSPCLAYNHIWDVC